ncbi:hypothetical protein CTAYLR_005659 [Chrysophaeum taylorii]|uniref:AAA+ ATPase domain-containing protein n=1 Tax=Chrysophaeum taylorii TaxID=2483200 RepID=A0AAD7XM03_9STRA|nr:hypothetical protein CTAYLR_005659 [Chrysophaeum taylorii]
MSLQARHRYIVARVSEGLRIKEEVAEEVVRRDATLARLNRFFRSGEANACLFFYVSSSSSSSKKEEEEEEEEEEELVCSEQPAMCRKTVYFLKRTSAALDPLRAMDGLVWFGTICAPLESLETMLRTLYGPAFSKNKSWGLASDDHIKEFLVSLEGFAKNVQDNVKSLGGGLELREPDHEAVAVDPHVAAASPEIVAHFIEVLEEWCTSIETYLSDTDRGRFETPESGPGSEIDYWRRRTQRLTTITDQLKTKRCKSVITMLTSVTKLVDNQQIFALMKRWRQIDVCITKAATEAKDNSKFLATLERFLEPLSSGTPETIIDTIPALMNALKMVHTISRFFNTTERTTKLLMKITNQMIQSCKAAIGRIPLWDQPTGPLLERLESCLKLNEFYQEQYRVTKDKLMTMPRGKQFDFAEPQIFGKFDLFCRRLIKLIDMFSTIKQFHALGEHNLEGMDPLLSVFEQILAQFKDKRHDLLDYHSNKFDRDYVEFNVRIGELETSLQHFINRSFESISSIEQSLKLLHKYQSILHRENLRSDLDSKFMIIFHNYGLELEHISEMYEAHKHAPPVARNMPPVAGNITWARHLLRRIEDPMTKFNAAHVLASKESKRIVRSYNKIAKTLLAFEYLWYDAWCKSVSAARAGLEATLVIRHEGKLYVNFDPQVLQLIRESKCLTRMGVEIPDDARMVLAQEEHFKRDYNELRYLLQEYDRICSRIQRVTEKVLEPHLRTLDCKLRPGMITLTWTSMNIDAYKVQVRSALRQLEDLIVKINDLVENRIEKNLKIIARTMLVDLPEDKSVTLDDFVSMQECAVHGRTQILVAKNVEVETAVEDLVIMLNQFPLDPSVKSDNAQLAKIKTHYNKLTYQALLSCARNSLNQIKKRVCSRVASGYLFVERPFFEVDVQLSVPSVRLSPSLDDVQRAINRSAVAVLGCAKATMDWGQLFEGPQCDNNNNNNNNNNKPSFFDRLGRDTEIIKVALLLTGALFATKNQVHDYLVAFKKYDWLWKDDKDLQYRKFAAGNPTIGDYENELRRFMNVEREIERIPPMHNIGALTLNTANLKLQLRNESRQWKIQYSTKVHQQARDAMYSLLEYIRVTTNKLHVEVKDLDSLRFVMTVLKEIRERESSIEMELTPIADMYHMLEHYLPGGLVDKDEMDQKSIMRPSWRKLVDLAETIADQLSKIQGQYKRQLILDVRDFAADAKQFRADFETNGPQQPGITPTEAVERLRRYKDELQMRERKVEMYVAGEELFALRTTKYPELVKTRKEVGLLDQLYVLYLDIQHALDNYRSVHWSDVTVRFQAMVDETTAFDARCKKLPKKLREWEAYTEMRAKVTDLQDLLPLIADLSKPSIKPRHWREVIDLIKTPLPFDKESFQLKHIFKSPLLQFKGQVEEICEGADKQLGIETKLADVKEQWDHAAFTLTKWKERDVPILLAFGQVIDDLEEAQLNLQSLLSMRHVGPFREAVASQLTTLSDTADTLELWIKVQLLWTSLESVFMGGDIAKQMPLEAKKFAKIDRDFVKIMLKASETQVVVACCGNELLRNTLPVLYDELEKCQKSLEGYLSQKRSLFPRFYFVSNPVLLLILSQGSDPMRMQPFYEKIFDAVNQVSHDKSDKSKIVDVCSIEGPDQEVIQLSAPVKAEGSIELWLNALVKEMQQSLKALCEQAAAKCSELPLAEFVNSTCAQFALLGIQFNWTAQCQEALDKSKTSKTIIPETNKQQLAVLDELSSWCLTDLKTKMNRRKIETLVTIHVHQRDVFADLAKLHKERKAPIDPVDFEWLKQARFYWRPNLDDAHGSGACVVSICDVDFTYNFEYLGCKERLVVTPLTDRCYITLSQALGMHLGGSPAGPAGTGKTETVKDLGRALGVFVVVTNCTDQQRFTDMAKIFKGLCQGGLWGCFDEFNRIELPVLSVVAQQVLAITNAKRIGARSFTFPGDAQPIELDQNVGYFITMNPGYAGRQELPQNLKTLFRSVAMMVPDREIIMKVKLCSVGYKEFTELARKFNVLYRLCEQQLSKQKHYDFGLRNILSVLRTAGQTKRDNQEADEEVLIMRTLRDMNLSKFVAEDVPLFLSLLNDLFPRAAAARDGFYDANPKLTAAIENAIHARALVDHPSWVVKVLQLYETTLVRHGIMLVGPPGAGKSSTIAVLQDALTATTPSPHKRVRMNPKAIRAEEMFGETDRLSGEWLNGVFAAIWSKFNDRSRKDTSWIVCDGPVDAVWIENLNTVLDDNRILTLANGDRVPMTDNVKLVFEVEDLRNASPATVSRAGIIFVSSSDLDWRPVLDAWLAKEFADGDPTRRDVVKAHLDRYLGTPRASHPGDAGGAAFEFIAKDAQKRPALAVTRVGAVEATLRLLLALLEAAELSQSKDDVVGELERLVAFAVTWGVAGILDAEDRQRWDAWMRESPAHGNMPREATGKETIFDFRVNFETMEWERWQPSDFCFDAPTNNSSVDWTTVRVPTVEMCRGTHLMGLVNATALKQRAAPVLIVGESGTAKTTMALVYFETCLDQDLALVKKMNFSSATTPGMFQVAVEAELDKQGGKNFGPPGGKTLTFFLDDVSMPAVNRWGDQPTCELVRQLVETGGFCFLDKDKRGDFKHIERVTYVAAMDVPGAGKNDIPNRLKRHFFPYHVVTPTEHTVASIYGQLLAARFSAYQHHHAATTTATKSSSSSTKGVTSPNRAQQQHHHHSKPESVFGYVGRIPAATMTLFKWAREKMLPSPSKFHYTFTLRDLSRLYQGILRTPDSTFSEVETHVVVLLWRHEAERVFADKLTNLEDKAAFAAQLDASTQILLVDTGGSPQSPSRGAPPSRGGKPPSSASSRPNTKSGSPPPKNNNNSNNVSRTNFSPLQGTSKHTDSASQLSSSSSSKDVVWADPEMMRLCSRPSYFVDFLRDDKYDEDGLLLEEAPKVFELAESLEAVRSRTVEFLAKYGEERTRTKLNLIMFDDAVAHLVRISRALGMRRGNMMLVGVGGSGKQSLAQLAAFVAGHELFQITLTKAYNMTSFLDDLRLMYKTCGQQRKVATFLFTDAQIKDENFLEVLNSLLLTGEVTGLFAKDELQMMAAELRADASRRSDYVDTLDFLVRHFYDTVRSNLHVVLCFSPVNRKFAERARKFPGLVNGCAVDWFLPWPAEALVAVSRGVLGSSTAIECDEPTKNAILQHMAFAHQTIVGACDEYARATRRRVYQTPTSYLSFLRDYEKVYLLKLREIEQKSARVRVGLEKLDKGGQDVERMKVLLADEEVKLRRADERTTAMLGKLQTSSLEAKKEADAVGKIKEACEADAKRIAGEKAQAETDLARAQPFVEEAERAVNSIKPNDLNELKKLQKPSDIIKLIFDVVGLLKMEKLNKIEPAEVTLGIGKEKKTFFFFKDSYKLMQQGLLSDARFLQNIFSFSKHEKDFINDETIELMLPYIELDEYNALVARNASKAAEGLCAWSRAMVSYHEASKIVKPKLEALRIAESRLADAQRELDKAEAKLQGCTDVLATLQKDFETQMKTKEEIEAGATATRKKMEQATALIGGLAGERERWTEDSSKFETMRNALVGDVAVASAFVSYCGPFNQEYRALIVQNKLMPDLKARKIPYTAGLDVVPLLASVAERGDWNLEGLPTDPLSIQNGILVTRASRYPLLIDPQGQALNWIKHHEASRLPAFGATTLDNPRLRDQLEFCMGEGKALVVVGVGETLDPMLDPVLQKRVVVKGRSKYITVTDKLCEFNEAEFALYLATRLPNPQLTPEDQAKTTVVDFTVTMKGLEEQLLGRVIQKEQRTLEEQLTAVLEQVATNTKALLRLDELLLERLSANNAGNLLDDEELISVLAETKAKALEVKDKLTAAAKTRESIKDKREQYRPAATRGSTLYFAIVDMTHVKHMYQTSLAQFQALFGASMDHAERAPLASKRVANVVETMTYTVYRAISRGLYEQDRLSFKLLMLFRIMINADRLKPSDVTLFLKGGAGLDESVAAKKTVAWLPDTAWLNVVQLSNDNVVFRTLPDDIARDQAEWRAWVGENEPETKPVPGSYETHFAAAADTQKGAFCRLLLVRALREDRTIPSVLAFIRAIDALEHPHQGYKIPALGPKYVEPVAETIETVFDASSPLTPVIYLLSAGADPTDAIETFARRRKQTAACVSMGEGQEPVALAAITTATANNEWALLQNAHLGLPFIQGLEDLLANLVATHEQQQQTPAASSPSSSSPPAEGTATAAAFSSMPDFRLWLTTEPHPSFPIGLLQISVKVTNEPPSGLRAGLRRSYTVLVDNDRLDRIETLQWRSLVYALCFLHSIAQERRKFGPMGFCVPYEFNDGDLNACLAFLERHLFQGPLSWPTLQYMVAEVQYGGKITDNSDRRLFRTYCETWLAPETCDPGFTFRPKETLQRIRDDFMYGLPAGDGFDDYVTLIKSFPDVDSPEVFGLHPNADLAFRRAEVDNLLATILETRPRDVPAGAGKSREEVVAQKCVETLEALPRDYSDDDRAALDRTVPLNAVLAQELLRLQRVIVLVRGELRAMLQAIRGEIVVTAQLLQSIDNIYDAKVPLPWVRSPGGDEISWLAPTFGRWLSGLADRDAQLRAWLDNLVASAARPKSFWLPGFFNPAGFLTAVQQEVTRAHANETSSKASTSWVLDAVKIHAEVTDFESADQIKTSPPEGVYVHGLSLDGAAWDRTSANATLAEAQPKHLFDPMPVLFVTALPLAAASPPFNVATSSSGGGAGSSATTIPAARVVPAGTRPATASSSSQQHGDLGPYGGFDCPVYRYARRTDKYYVFSVKLPSLHHPPDHWILRGVALLCFTA